MCDKDKEIFSLEEISILWRYKENPYYQMILILIYTGVRIGELLSLKKENVYLDKQYFIVIKSKTQNGVRKVPIADNILPFFQKWINTSKIDFVLNKLWDIKE